MKTLLVMRHAKSDWHADHSTDHDRPVSERGTRDARRMGRALSERGMAPDHVMSSPAIRARTTAELAMESGGWPASLTLHPEIYEKGVDGVVELLKSAPEVGRLMIVGHQPTWSMLVGELTGMTAQMKTASVAVIELPMERWADLEAGGVLTEEITPRDLDDSPVAPSGPIIPEGSWMVSAIAVGGELVPPLDGSELRLVVEGQRISGFSGVNRFTGTMGPAGPGPMATTRMAGPPDWMEQEQRFLGYLGSADHSESTDSGINLVESGLITVTLTSVESPSGSPQDPGDG